LNALRQIFHRLWRWLAFPGPIPMGTLPSEEAAKFFLTGPDLIERIVRAIQLNQSVVLSGPRGCGKSHCIGAAIEAAKRQDIIQGDVFLQGNREIPRDYLIEDEIAFKTTVDGKKQTLVVPFRRSSPLFAFADRDPQTGAPLLVGESVDRRVRCVSGNDKSPWKEGPKIDCKRFALFLDEINRFSDGVLDSLLSVLEERKAVLAGEVFVLPVVVCMTMNPPGYDGSARKLSPPLAARIGRTYRLSTADLDTLADQIIRAKMIKLSEAHAASRSELLKMNPSSHFPEFPDVTPEIIRKVALVTLMCWGDVSGQKPGTEYLTPSTQLLLRRVMANDNVARACMTQLSGLCQFGPDGRAGADWLTTAIGVALTDASRRGDAKATLTGEHLIATVTESVAHKIYDNFSQSSRPDLTALKEQQIETLCRQVFNRPYFGDLVRRKIDDLEGLGQAFSQFIGGDMRSLQQAFMDSGVVSDADISRWKALAQALQPDASNLLTLLSEPERTFLVDDDPDTGLALGFRRISDDALARRMANMTGSLAETFRGLLESNPPSLGPRRVTIEEEVASSYTARCVGVQKLLKACGDAGILSRTLVLVLVRQLAAETFTREVEKSLNQCPPRHQDQQTQIKLLNTLRALLDPMLRAVVTARETEAVVYYSLFKQLDARLLAMSGRIEHPV
jgi:MoxR-like ATPase